MSNPVIIIDNKLELNVIEKSAPHLKDVPLILLSSKFNPNDLRSFKKRRFTWFDEKIDKKEAVKLTKNIMRHWTLVRY